MLPFGVLALAGCPPPTHYLITDVTSQRGPVPDAMVAVDCARPDNYPDAAVRTDGAGRARLMLRTYKLDASRCAVTVAKEGYATVEAGAVNICTTSACPPTVIELREPYGPVPVRSYARPAEVAR